MARNSDTDERAATAVLPHKSESNHSRRCVSHHEEAINCERMFARARCNLLSLSLSFSLPPLLRSDIFQ